MRASTPGSARAISPRTCARTAPAWRARIAAALGPMIRQKSYEVGPEFLARFLAADAGNEAFFAPAGRAGHAMFDLGGYAARRLAQAGVGNVEDLGHCTYADPAAFFS